MGNVREADEDSDESRRVQEEASCSSDSGRSCECMSDEPFQERGMLMKFRRWMRDGEVGRSEIAERYYCRESAMNQCRQKKYRLF
jgi:hypothetical protein